MPIAVQQRAPLQQRGPRGYFKNRVWRAVVTFVLLYGALFAYIDVNQDQLAFPAPLNTSDSTPSSAGMAFEDLHIPVNATEQIHAWYIPSARPSRKVILFLHGNGYSLEDAVEGEASRLHEIGANLLLIDYRGYGSSSRRQANGLRICEDGRAALRYLIDQRHVPISEIVIFGRSIGTGAASQLAFENPHAAGLILLSAFTTLKASARQSWMMRLLPLELMGSGNRLDSLAKMEAIHLPLLIAAGTEDKLTPPWMAKTLFAHGNQPKKLYLVPGAGHNDTWATGGGPLIEQLKSFVAFLDRDIVAR